MIARGRVQNGVIVLADGVSLDDGIEVTVEAVVRTSTGAPERQTHSLLNIPPVRVGAILSLEAASDDLLGEMLEDRR